MNATSPPCQTPTGQFEPRPGLIDLAWGHPHPAALPTDAWAEATARALRRHGPVSLAYGRDNGPGPFVDWLADRLGTHPDGLFVTAGASAGFDLVCRVLLRPGDTVLVDYPTYHLALRVLADHDVRILPAPVDDEGIDPDRLAGLGARLLYLVPTFGNPTGASLPEPRRAALVEAAHRAGVVVVEDDTYRELGYDGPAPPPLRGYGPGVVRVGSFAKTVAPGLRVGFVDAEPDVIQRLSALGFLESGGGLNHTNAVVLSEFVADGRYERHLDALRARYGAQRDALAAAVATHCPQATFERPAGGWFVWVRLPAGQSATDLLPHAEVAGVSYLDGARFFVDGARGEDCLRLSFSMLDPDVLAEGARRLGAAQRTM